MSIILICTDGRAKPKMRREHGRLGSYGTDPDKTLTLEEFLQLPETKPANEYINGQVIQKPMPQGKHSRIRGTMLTAINAVAKTPRIALTFPELRCSFGGRPIVPNVAVLCNFNARELLLGGQFTR